MGMQIHWNISNVPDYAVVTISGKITEIHIKDEILVTVENASEGCWFDCGSCSEWAMNMIQWLIRNRIPFNAS